MKVDYVNCIEIVTTLSPEISGNLDWTEFDPTNLPGLQELNAPNEVLEDLPQPQKITNYTVGSRVCFLGGGKRNNLLATITEIKACSTSSVSQFIILRFDVDLPPHLKEQSVTVPQNAHWLCEC